MRAKRSKQYKKLVQQFILHHGFREPFQVLVDGEIVRDAQRFTMDLQAGLERTLHGKVKIMITQCCIRHLYEQAREPGLEKAIALAKTFERRRCGHRPEDYDKPLTALECLSHVVDDKNKGENKHRYVVASQDLSVRRYMRAVTGVPLIYISRSVMIMEPMTDATARVGQQAERAKFRDGLRKVAGEKRKREADEEDDDGSDDDGSDDDDSASKKRKTAGQKEEEPKKKKKKPWSAVKGPNPLSVKKAKKKDTKAAAAASSPASAPASAPASTADSSQNGTADGAPKKKRKRKSKAQSAGDGGDSAAVPVSADGN